LGESFTLESIRDGACHLLFTTGGEWNGVEAHFTKDPRFQRFEDALNFTTTPTATGRRYSVWKVALHPQWPAGQRRRSC